MPAAMPAAATEFVFDLDAYLRRLAFDPSVRLRADLDTLIALHRAHVSAIPFENLDIQMRRGVRIDLASLDAKLVRQHRGGYCFEHNTLFAAALRTIGFTPRTLEARVRQGQSDHVRPRTHMCLQVPIDGHVWHADVGFGGDGLIEPLRTDNAAGSVQLGSVYRLHGEQSQVVLQRSLPGANAGAFEDLYVFSPEPVFPIDYEVGNWFTSTHPHSPFVHNLVAQRVIPSDGTRHTLRNLTYTIASGTDVTSREIVRAELIPLLRTTFGIDVPEDARFAAFDES